jgi:glycosyltransferase involved in cell wall biosynthesis
MQSNTLPLISVVIAVFNGAKTLQQCIDSVVHQTYKNIELIIIDGGSRDGTCKLLEENGERINYWVSEPDSGIYEAWNKGLQQTRGEWICFIGADDFFWNDQVLEKIGVQLAALPAEARVAYSQMMVLNHDDEGLYSIGAPWDEVSERFRQIMCIPHPGLMHRRSVFSEHGNFDASFRIAGDYELLLRELKDKRAFFMPGVIAVGMRHGGISSDPKNALAALREVRRAQKMHGQGLPGRIWLMAVTRVYIRLILWNLVGEKLTRKVLDIGRRIMGQRPHWTRT